MGAGKNGLTYLGCEDAWEAHERWLRPQQEEEMRDMKDLV
jgi:hypothetical protein